MNKITTWIDCDTGVDDAVALLTAFQLEELDIVGISTLTGNVPNELTFKNTRDVVHLANKNIKVYPGAKKPLVVEYHPAYYAHGANGLGGAVIEESDAPVETTLACDAIYEAAKAYPDLKLVAVGPLTNIATTITKYPDFVDYCKEIFIMGGSAQKGNVTPEAEFNIYCDPHAAAIVFKSGLHVHMFGLDVTTKALLNPEDIDEICSYGNKASDLFRDSIAPLLKLNESNDKPGLCEHDTCPLTFLVHPDWFTGQEAGIYVETDDKLTLGKTVVDIWSDHKFEDRHCTIYMDLDNDKFKKLIKDSYKKY